MKDLHIALKYIQGKLSDNEQIIITKEGFDIKLIKANNDTPPMDAGNAGNINPVPNHIYGVDVDMHRHMYD